MLHTCSQQKGMIDVCGITGWVHFGRHLRQEKETVLAMANTLSLRGPDDTNVWLDDHVAFGHKRLVVVDPAGGVQPMTRMKTVIVIRFVIMGSYIIQKIFEQSY